MCDLSTSLSRIRGILIPLTMGARADSIWAMKVYPTKPPRILDLFCGAGAVSVGYSDAGFECVGVDIKKQSRYPFEFHQFDAMRVVQSVELVEWLNVDYIHASPPCQSYSFPTMHLSYGAPKLVEPLRPLLQNLVELGLIRGYVIENVVDAPLGPKYAKPAGYDVSAIMLCGTMFGKRIYRHRLFEGGGITLVEAGFGCDHSIASIDIFGGGRWVEEGTGVPVMHVWIDEMFDGRAGLGGDLKWPITQEEAKQAVPCCYTEYIGLQLKESMYNGS
jgi:DNA (cytosine-5)-methyltransferase 1